MDNQPDPNMDTATIEQLEYLIAEARDLAAIADPRDKAGQRLHPRPRRPSLNAPNGSPRSPTATKTYYAAPETSHRETG